MKNKIALAAAAASILFTGAASAADLAARPYTKAPPMVAPVWSWTGCYIGGNVGYDRGDVRSSSVPNAAYIAGAAGGAAEAATQVATSPVTNHPDGVTVGGGVGCNYQTGMFVIGGEADINYSDLRFGQIRGPFPPAPGAVPYTWEEQFRSQWFVTARARAGLVIAERNLLYVTGGAAFAEFNGIKALDFPGFVGFRYQGNFDDTRVGWVVGAGWEYAFSNNWSAKVEYLHMDFGNLSAFSQRNIAAPPAAGWTHTYNLREDVVRVGLNYRFGGMGPVVAKY